jgi:hypothetical protein
MTDRGGPLALYYKESGRSLQISISERLRSPDAASSMQLKVFGLQSKMMTYYAFPIAKSPISHHIRSLKYWLTK